MKRRQTLKFAVSAVTVGLAPFARSQTREMRLGTVFASNSNLHRGALKFSEALFQESKGRYKINVYADSQIGDIAGLITGMQVGTIDMALLGMGNATTLKGAGPLSVAYVPYLFKSKKGVADVVNGPLFAPILENAAKESGVRVFVLDGARSPRAIQTTRGPILRPEDLKGMRMRVPPVELFRATFEKLGVKAVPTGVSEIYLALSKGQVEGQDNGFDMSLTFKWHEVAKFWSETEHNFEPCGWYIGEKLWQSLPPADQEIFKRAARMGGAVITELGEVIDRNGVETLKSLGVAYVKPDLGPWREALKDVHVPYEGKLWPAGMVEKIRALPENK